MKWAVVFVMWAGTALAQTCGPDAAPTAATAAGYTCETFYDHFTSTATIDTTNSLNPGFKWYLGQTWPRAASGNSGSWPWSGAGPTPSSWYSVSGGLLHLTPLVDDPTDLGQIMLSSCAPTTTPPYWVGTAFTGGFYLRSQMSYTATNGGSNGWPLVWMWPLEHLLATTSGAPSYVEHDHHEAVPGSSGWAALHYWQCASGSCPTNDYNTGPGIPSGTIADSLSTATKLDYLFNGVFQATAAVPSGAPASIFNLLYSNHECLFLGGGLNDGVTDAVIQVWQAPPPPGGGSRRGLRR